MTKEQKEAEAEEIKTLTAKSVEENLEYALRNIQLLKDVADRALAACRNRKKILNPKEEVETALRGHLELANNVQASLAEVNKILCFNEI
jgi:hypothetical protein